MPKRLEAEMGEKHGFLTLISEAPPNKRGATQATFKCQCGAEVVRVLTKVRRGTMRSCGKCGCLRSGLPPAEIAGERFGRLAVLERSPTNTKQGHTRWVCLCDCGETTVVSLRNLRNGSTRSCGCLAKERASRMGKARKGKRAWNWKGIGDISGSFWNQILASAECRNLPVEISLPEIWALFLRQGRKCALSGLPLEFDGVGERNTGSASLDRIDSTKGYTLQNVQWVDKRIQQMKWNLPEPEFVALCHAIAKNHFIGS